MQLERMDEFFAARVKGYDEHMLETVNGCKNGYHVLAKLLPDGLDTLLDLGCGTGLELEEIYERFPDLRVTGVDMTRAMLAELRERFYDKPLDLILGSYTKVDLGRDKFDAAVSFETMHHLSHEEKLPLYTNIYNALHENGVYIECDYMIIEQQEEDFYYAEYARLKAEQHLPEGEFYHYDTPCTIQNQFMLMKKAGFKTVECPWREGNTTIILAWKQEQSEEY